MLKAVTRSAQLIDQKLAVINEERAGRHQNTLSVANYFDHYAAETDTEVSVIEDDFTKAKDELAPSVSSDELRHYERVRDTFEGVNKRPTSNGERATTQKSDRADASDASLPKLNELTRRARESENKVPVMNGSKGVQNSGGRSFGADDDFVVRTDRLSMNAANRPPSSKGKGKAKGREMSIVDGTAIADDAEDLYD